MCIDLSVEDELDAVTLFNFRRVLSHLKASVSACVENPVSLHQNLFGLKTFRCKG
jgi:hypothetical protein